MQKDLPTIQAPTYEELLATQAEYEATQQVMTNGRGLIFSGAAATRRLADDEIVQEIDDVSPSSDPTIVKMLADTASAYEALKAAISSITDIPEGESEPIGVTTSVMLRDTVEKTDETTSVLDQSLAFFASKIEIIVLEPISILAPMPFTGAWNAGLTMRTSRLWQNQSLMTINSSSLATACYTFSLTTNAILQPVRRPYYGSTRDQLPLSTLVSAVLAARQSAKTQPSSLPRSEFHS
jgi:hypothetical protein